MAGAFGTLGFLTEVTFKAAALAGDGGDARHRRAFRSARHRGALRRARLAFRGDGRGASSRRHRRGEGPHAHAARRLRKRGELSGRRRSPKRCADFGKARSSGCARRARSCGARCATSTFLASPGDTAIWRVSVAPTQGAGARPRRSAPKLSARWFYDWGGGLVWLSCGAEGDAGAALVHEAARSAGGHALLVRAPDAVRAAVDVFQPQPEAMMKLTRALKASFDPSGVLEPGRMHAGA